MKYRQLGRTGIFVSEVCMGAMTFGGVTDEKESKRIVERCLDRGVNFFDTANVYTESRSEEILGRAIGGHRDSLVVATKVFAPVGEGPNDTGLSRKHILKACEDSLRRLGTDYIDLYQVHGDDRWTPLEETLRALDDLVRSGKVRYIGASNYGAWRLNDALWISQTNGLARYDCLQPLYNLIDRGLDAELLPLCRDKGVGVIAWSPLSGGWLTGKYREQPTGDTRLADTGAPSLFGGGLVDREAILDALIETAKKLGHTPAQIALRWVMDQEGVTCAILGARNMEQLEDNLGALDVKLDTDTWKALDRISRPPLSYPSGMQVFQERRRRDHLARAGAR